jgi:hypothetical protein
MFIEARNPTYKYSEVGTCHCGISRPQVADGRNSLQIWKVSANILNKQLRTADRGRSSSLGMGLFAEHRILSLVSKDLCCLCHKFLTSSNLKVKYKIFSIQMADSSVPPGKSWNSRLSWKLTRFVCFHNIKSSYKYILPFDTM